MLRSSWWGGPASSAPSRAGAAGMAPAWSMAAKLRSGPRLCLMLLGVALGVLGDGGPHVGGAGFSLDISSLHDHHLCRRWRLDAPSLAVNQPVVAEVARLQVTGLSPGCLLDPLHREAGAVPQDHPLQWVDVEAAPLTTALGNHKR